MKRFRFAVLFVLLVVIGYLIVVVNSGFVRLRFLAVCFGCWN